MDIGFKNIYYTNLPSPVAAKDEMLLEVQFYLALRPNHAGNIVYAKGAGGFQKILNYSAVYRWSDVMRKVWSRQVNEQVRNDKWLVCGLGRSEAGHSYYFVHPFAQHCQSKVVVPQQWAMKADEVMTEHLLWGSAEFSDEEYPALSAIAEQFPPVAGGEIFTPPGVFEAVAQLIVKHRQQMQPVKNIFSKIQESAIQPTSLGQGKAGAVLFGYGNYARTIAVPFMQPHVVLQKIHEVDPALLANTTLPASANPLPDDGDENYDAWLIAGFHHTHAGLAIQALQQGVIPVIEKPIATTLSQFRQLETAVQQSAVPFFQCFQKRYQLFNPYSFADLDVRPGQPIHYKAVVYEIPLHRQHWYNWPVSGSRIISNGCHWIDHFMFLNQYAQCVHAEVKKLNQDELLLILQLENGATGVITLSDVGANRIGMREYVELSVPGRRITIVDSMHYRSETDARILRKAKTDKLHYLRRMYSQIGKAVVSKAGGDTIESLRSSLVAIELDEQMRSL